MACADYDKCRNFEMNRLQFPTDNNSLYDQKIYDNQTANSRCYSKHPSDIIKEGFSTLFTWENFIKLVIVVLLIILIVSLCMDHMKTEVKMVGGGFGDADSYFSLTAISDINTMN